ATYSGRSRSRLGRTPPLPPAELRGQHHEPPSVAPPQHRRVLVLVPALTPAGQHDVGRRLVPALLARRHAHPGRLEPQPPAVRLRPPAELVGRARRLALRVEQVVAGGPVA